MADGGLRTKFLTTSHSYYEEYPSSPASHVLNGYIFTMLGLYDFRVAGYEPAGRKYEAAVAALAYTLPFHDTGTYGAYHLATSPRRPVRSTGRRATTRCTSCS